MPALLPPSALADLRLLSRHLSPLPAQTTTPGLLPLPCRPEGAEETTLTRPSGNPLLTTGGAIG